MLIPRRCRCSRSESRCRPKATRIGLTTCSERRCFMGSRSNWGTRTPRCFFNTPKRPRRLTGNVRRLSSCMSHRLRESPSSWTRGTTIGKRASQLYITIILSYSTPSITVIYIYQQTRYRIRSMWRVLLPDIGYRVHRGESTQTLFTNDKKWIAPQISSNGK